MIIPSQGIQLRGPAGDDTLVLEGALGKGAFGVVYKARDKTNGVVYAVKFPDVASVGDPAIMAAFQNEVMAASHIRHPNVINIEFVNTAPADLPPYLVMEYIGGGTLRSHVNELGKSNDQLSPKQIRIWADGLINGISAINTKMLHRDLNLGNIMIDGDVPKIGDFGLAKIVGAITRTNTLKGHQHMLFMAPEGWLYELNDIQIDMYAMGIVLYQMASLRYPYDLPFAGASPEIFKDMHLTGHAKPLNDLRPDLPIAFCHVVARLMNKRPHDRYPDWAEAKDATDRAWAQLGTVQPSHKDLIQGMVQRTGLIHEQQGRERTEAEKAAARRQEQHVLNGYQWDQLVKTITEAAEEFNKHSELGKITTISSVHGDVQFYLTINRKNLHLRAMWPIVPLDLQDRGIVHYAAYLEDSDGVGLNYLLCRENELDVYGTWLACEIRLSALADPNTYPPQLEPFCFKDERALPNIVMANRAVHVYEITLYDDIAKGFLKVAEAALRRPGSGPHP